MIWDSVSLGRWDGVGNCHLVGRSVRLTDWVPEMQMQCSTGSTPNVI